MTDGFERNNMNDMNNTNNTNSENEQVQNSFSTADNSQTDTSANASGYNAGSSYTSSYDAQQNAYNSYYNYANGANNTGANNTGANNIHVAPGANKPPKKNGKGALVAGIISIVLSRAGFAGTVLGNSINATIPFASSSDGTSQGESADSGSESTIAAPSTTLNTSNAETAAPLDESKINDSSNSTLLNAEELYEKVKNTVVLVYNYQRQTGYAEPVKYGTYPLRYMLHIRRRQR